MIDWQKGRRREDQKNNKTVSESLSYKIKGDTSINFR